MKLVVATHNEGKLVEIHRILEEDLGADSAQVELVSAGSLGLPDPVETGVTFQENALLKARFVAGLTGLPAIADDSGLIVDVMGNAPGILSARWAGEHGNDPANNALLLAQLSDIPDAARTLFPLRRRTGRAGFRGPCGGRRHAIVSETVEIGEMPGRILRAARGEHGFGYDPLFVPDDQPERGRCGPSADQRGDGRGRKERDFAPRQSHQGSRAGGRGAVAVESRSQNSQIQKRVFAVFRYFPLFPRNR